MYDFCAIQRGLVPGSYVANVTGRSTNITTTQSDVWIVGGTLVYPTVAAPLNISSTSAQDNPAGTGIGTVIVQGLDANGIEIQELIALNGLGVVTTAQSFLRVNLMQYINGNGPAAGNITAISQNTGLPIARIATGETRTQLSHFTIPSGKSGLILNFVQSPNISTTVTTYISGRISGTSAFVNQVPITVLSADFVYTPQAPLGSNILNITQNGQLITAQARALPGMTDLKVRAASTSGTRAVSTIMQILVEKA